MKLILSLIFLFFGPLPLMAQVDNPEPPSAEGDTSDDVFGDSSQPIDISAEDGLEWRRDEHLYIARGSAKAIRGKGTAEADILMAFYDDTGKKLQRLVGEGNVVLTSDRTVMTGQHGDYNVPDRFLRLTGDNLSIKTKNETITSSKAIDYWAGEKIVKTRGDTKITQKDTVITSNNSTIYLHKDGSKKGEAYQIESNGNVKITTPKQVATANRLIHNIEKDISVLTGNVLIVEGDRRIRGDRAEIDHKTGISRLLSGGSRVRVNIDPRNPSGSQARPANAAPPTP